MVIRLDDDGGGPSATLEEARDRARQASEAVRYWEGVLRERVAEAESLDGWLTSAVGALLGTRQRRIDEAVARVQEARGRLATARAAADQAKAELEAAEARDRGARDAEAVRIGRLELLADEIRGTAHPLAAELDEIELGLDATRAELAPLEEVLQAGSALIGWLGRAGTETSKGTRAAMYDLADIPLAGVAKLTRIHATNSALKEIAPRAQRFEAACAAIGLSIDLGIAALRAPSMGVDVLTDSVFADLWSLERLQDLERDVESAKDEVRGVLGGIQGRAAGLGARIAELEARRTELLERATS